MEKQQIVVLDFSTVTIYLFSISKELSMKDFVDIAQSIEEKYGIKLKEGNCEWMISEDMNIIIGKGGNNYTVDTINGKNK